MKKKGAHTLQPLWSDIAWMFRIISLKRHFPATNSRQRPWPEDSWRSTRAGKTLCNGKAGVLVEVSTDLDEYCLYVSHHFTEAPSTFCKGKKTKRRPDLDKLNLLASP